MKYNFLNTSKSNIYTKPSRKAEVSSQIIYGEKFRILSKQKSWLKKHLQIKLFFRTQDLKLLRPL